MDEIRRQLAELMDSVDTDAGSRKSFADADICKYYLSGLCPHDLFQNTKQYMGECTNTHSDDLKEQYLEARKKANYGYEEMTLRYLKPHIDDCDRRIARQTIGGRCDTQDKASESIEASARREVEALESQIAEKMKEAEELGNKGDVEGSMKIMDGINQLNAKKKMALEEKSSKVEEAKSMYFQKLKPCEACGALLSEKDGENRLNEHFLGRIHLGFEAIRKHVKELDEYITNTASSLPRDAAYNCRPTSGAAVVKESTRRSVEPDHRRDENGRYSGDSHKWDSSYRHNNEGRYREGDRYRQKYEENRHHRYSRKSLRPDGEGSIGPSGDAQQRQRSEHQRRNHRRSSHSYSRGRSFERSGDKSRDRSRERSRDRTRGRREHRSRSAMSERRKSTRVNKSDAKIESEEEEGQIDQK